MNADNLEGVSDGEDDTFGVDPLSEAAIAAEAAEFFRRARHRSVAWLSRREYATGEMQTKLLSKDIPAPIVKQTMEWLLDNDLLSNQRFSEAFSRRRARQGYGPIRTKMEMRARGVPDALIDSAVNAINWLDAAQLAWDKRFRSQTPETAEQRAKQQKYLAQRGFSHDIIRNIF